MHVAGRNHKKAVVPVTTRKLWAKQLQAQYKVSISLSCLASGVSRSAFYYEQKCSDDTEVIDVLNQIVQTHQRWGFPKCFVSDPSMALFTSHEIHGKIFVAGVPRQ